MRALAFTLMVLVLAAYPAAVDASNQVEAVHWPVRDAVFTPQLGCVFHFDTDVTERCEDFGDLIRASQLTVRIIGSGSAFAFADDITTSISKQLAVASCSGTGCSKSFPVTGPVAGRLHAEARGTPGTTIIVSVESGLDTVLP